MDWDTDFAVATPGASASGARHDRETDASAGECHLELGRIAGAADRLAILGAIDVRMQSRLRDVFADLKSRAKPLVIDLTGVTHIDTSCLETLCRAQVS